MTLVSTQLDNNKLLVEYETFGSEDAGGSLIITLDGEAVYFATHPIPAGSILLAAEPADGVHMLLAFLFNTSVRAAFGLRLEVAAVSDPNPLAPAVTYRSVVAIEPVELGPEADGEATWSIAPEAASSPPSSPEPGGGGGGGTGGGKEQQPGIGGPGLGAGAGAVGGGRPVTRRGRDARTTVRARGPGAWQGGARGDGGRRG